MNRILTCDEFDVIAEREYKRQLGLLLADRLRVLDGICLECKAILSRSKEPASQPETPSIDDAMKAEIVSHGLTPFHYTVLADRLKPMQPQHFPSCSKARS